MLCLLKLRSFRTFISRLSFSSYPNIFQSLAVHHPSQTPSIFHPRCFSLIYLLHGATSSWCRRRVARQLVKRTAPLLDLRDASRIRKCYLPRFESFTQSSLICESASCFQDHLLTDSSLSLTSQSRRHRLISPPTPERLQIHFFIIAHLRDLLHTSYSFCNH